MAEFPALQLWTDAYLGDTTHLSTAEHGAYLLLLMVAWRSPNCRLPNDDKMLARYTRLPLPAWLKMKPTILSFFTLDSSHLVQKRLMDEYILVRSRREKAAQAGKASALKRKGRHAALVEPELPPSDNETPTNGQHYHSHSHNTPFDKESNGAIVDPDKAFWDAAKAYLGAAKASLIGKWVSEHGREATASAIAAAQVERAVDPTAFIGGYFRKRAQPAAAERPIC